MNRQVFSIAPDHPCLDGHFPDAPIVPGVVVLERVIDTVQAESARAVVGIRRCKFLSGLYPGQTCTIEWSAPADGEARFVCRGPDGVLARGVLGMTGSEVP